MLSSFICGAAAAVTTAEAATGAFFSLVFPPNSDEKADFEGVLSLLRPEAEGAEVEAAAGAEVEPEVDDEIDPETATKELRVPSTVLEKEKTGVVRGATGVGKAFKTRFTDRIAVSRSRP